MKSLTMLRAFLGLKLTSAGRALVQQDTVPNDTFCALPHAKASTKRYRTITSVPSDTAN